MIKIQGPGFFATRNPPVVIHVITGSSIWRVYFNILPNFSSNSKVIQENIYCKF